VNKRAKLPALCAPINRDHAYEHERKPEFCFEVRNETRNPPWRRHVPIKYCGVPCAHLAKKPNHKSGCVSRPADAFGICHSTQPGLSFATRREDQHQPRSGQALPPRQSVQGLWACRNLLWPLQALTIAVNAAVMSLDFMRQPLFVPQRAAAASSV